MLREDFIQFQGGLCRSRLFRTGVFCGCNEKNILRFFQHLLPFVIIDSLVQQVYQIDGVFIHAVQKHVRRIQDNADLYIWMLFMETFQQSRENGGTDGFDGSDGKKTVQFLGFCDGCFCFGQIFHNGYRIVVEDRTLMGQNGLFADSVE